MYLKEFIIVISSLITLLYFYFRHEPNKITTNIIIMTALILYIYGFINYFDFKMIRYC